MCGCTAGVGRSAWGFWHGRMVLASAPRVNVPTPQAGAGHDFAMS